RGAARGGALHRDDRAPARAEDRLSGGSRVPDGLHRRRAARGARAQAGKLELWRLPAPRALRTSVLNHIVGPIGYAFAMRRQLTAIIEREGDGYVSLCPELDIASQGASVEEARANLTEALELFFETADAAEVKARLHDEVFVTRVDVTVG